MATPGLIFVITRPFQPETDPSAFVNEVREAHKSRKVFLEIAEIKVLSHEHYRPNEEAPRGSSVLDVYEVSDIEPLLSGRMELEDGGDGPVLSADTYVYKTISTHGTTATHSSDVSGELVLINMDPPLTILDEFNRFYEEEHIPLLSKVPGYLSVIRGKLLLLSDGADQETPKYGTFVRYAPENGLGTSDEWKAATSTEWNEKVIGTIKREGKRTRSVWAFEKTHDSPITSD